MSSGRRRPKYLVGVLFVLIAVTSPGAFGETAPVRASRAERRAVALVARALWPQLAPDRIAAWSKTAPPRAWSSATPDEFAARVVGLIGVELDAQAAGTPPDAERLIATIDVILDAVAQFTNVGQSPVAIKQRDFILKVQAGLATFGLGTSGFVYALFEQSPELISSGFELAMVPIPLVTALFMAAALVWEISPEPGVYSMRSRFPRAYAEFRSSLDRRLRAHRAWQRVSPDPTTGSTLGDLGSLTRFVWSPGSLRVACDRFFTQPRRVSSKR